MSIRVGDLVIACGDTTINMGCVSSMANSLKRAFSLCGFALVVGAMLLVTLRLYFGSMKAAACYFRGEPVCILQDDTDIGTVSPAKPTTITFTVKNSSRREVRVLGAQANCGCTVVDDLPLTLEAREARILSCSVTPSKAWVGKRFALRAVLFTDVPGNHPVFTIRGEVR